MKLLIVTQKVDANDQLLGFFIPWLSRFAQRFDQVLVFCLEKGEFVLPENVRVIGLGKQEKLPKFRWLLRFWRLAWALRREYDAVFVHMNPIWVVVGGFLWRGLDKKIFFWYTHKAVTMKLRLAERLADVIFTASPESFRIPSKKVIVTGHGIDTEFFKPNPALPRKPMSILSVGRIAPIKNYEVLINAVMILVKDGFNVAVSIVGEPALKRDGDYLSKLTSQVKNLGLENSIEFTGKKQGVALVEQYQSHRLLVHMSNTGSLDKVILEAMACGMRVVSSNDAARAFLPQENIFRADDPRDLAAKIRMLHDKAVPESFREYVVTHHALDRLIDRVEKAILA